jgi:pimeloyl-ACP methyl ester carboxylesterase
VSAGGRRIRGDSWARQGARPRIFLHGFGSDRAGEKAAAFRAAALREGDDFVAFDFGGHGQSTGTLEEMGIRDYVADAEAVLARFASPARRAVLVGSSLGGLISLWTARRNPDLVQALVLIAPALGWFERLERLPREGGRIVVKSPWLEKRLSLSTLEEGHRWSEEELVAELSTPSLFLHGTRDDQVPCSVSVEFTQGAASARCELHLFGGGDHRLLEVRDRMAELADEFLRSVEA